MQKFLTSETKDTKEKSTPQGKYGTKWRLENIYADEKDWESDFEYVKKGMPEIAGYKGKLKDEKSILACFEHLDKLSVLVEKLFIYAHCKRDEDTRQAKYNTMFGRIAALATDYGTYASFIEPELSLLSDETLTELSKSKALENYDYMLQRLAANKPHILSEKEEKLLAQAGEFSDEFSNIFTMIDNADLDFGTIKVDGKEVKLSHAKYQQLLQNPDQSVRKDAFESYYKSYQKVINTTAATYNGEVKKNNFYSKVRNYETYLEKALKAEDVPEKVYDTLIKSVADGLPTLHKYIEYRKKALGVDNLYMYDMSVAVVPNANLEIEYDEACDLVLKALAPLGEDYCEKIRQSFTDGWIDVYEQPGKRSGAYCTHAYAAPHPYVMLNYAKTTSNVFTIAHELGHAMHSHYSSRLPYSKANYRIFVAEVASTVNEMLLLDYLYSHSDDEKLKKYLLSYRMDSIRTTIFRQTMFSEFEKTTHEKVAKGEPLTVDYLNGIYGGLNDKYYGAAVSKDDYIQIEWSRIPHFYMSFYVYKYATGLISAINIADRIKSGEKGIIEKYMRFLSAGGSKSPYEILKDCGVDLCKKEAYSQTMDIFKDTLDKLNKS